MTEGKTNPFYVEENIRERLIDEKVDIEALSLCDLLASERTELAEERNMLAFKRNLQATERTHSAWIQFIFILITVN